MPETVAEVTLTDQATDALVGDIVSGVLAPGDRLRIDHLRKRYPFGISPLREALIRLATQGLVTLESRRGFRVSPISGDDLRDITKTRQVVELAALARSIELGGDEWEVGVISAMARLRLVVNRYHGDAYALIKDIDPAHMQLHSALLAACDSPRLLQYQASLYDQAKRYRYVMLKKIDDLQHYVRIHEELIAVVLSREVERAQEALGSHLALTSAFVEQPQAGLSQE